MARSPHAHPMDERTHEAVDAMLARLHAEIARSVDEHGWTIVVQPADPQRLEPSLAYTVGLAEKGLAEVLVFGLDADSAHVALDAVARRLLRDAQRRPAPHERFRLVGDVDAVLRPVPKHRVQWMMPAAIARLGGSVPAWQLVWADEAGRFPWNVGFNPEYAACQTPMYASAGRA